MLVRGFERIDRETIFAPLAGYTLFFFRDNRGRGNGPTETRASRLCARKKKTGEVHIWEPLVKASRACTLYT